jgi:hypothetical protein
MPNRSRELQLHCVFMTKGLESLEYLSPTTVFVSNFGGLPGVFITGES